MAIQKLSFTLDSITYKALVSSNDDIEVVLPRRESSLMAKSNGCVNDKFVKNKNLIVSPTTQTEIRLFLVVKENCSPGIKVSSKDGKAIINFANVPSLPETLPENSTVLLIFSTVNGGSTWLVDYQVFTTEPLDIGTGGGGSGEGTTDHRKLTHRNDADQHDVSAISGLQKKLTDLQTGVDKIPAPTENLTNQELEDMLK